MKPPTKRLKLGFSSPFLLLVSLTALVVVVAVAVAGVWCSWSQASTSSCYSWPPSCQLLHNGCFKTSPRTCVIIEIKYILPKRGHLPQYSYGSRIPSPGTRRRHRLVSGSRDPWSLLILGQVTQYGNPYLISITIEIVQSCTKPSYLGNLMRLIQRTEIYRTNGVTIWNNHGMV